MTEQQVYERALGILDNFLKGSLNETDKPPLISNWKSEVIFKLLKQSNHILFVLLSNSEKSKYQRESYVTDLILIGSLGRIIRDIYVNIIYLRSTVFSEDEMKLCWDYQVICQKLNALKFASTNKFKKFERDFNSLKDELRTKMESIEFSTKGLVFQGKSERLLSLSELAELKNFNKELFENEFSYFSQYAHSTAFANEFITEKGVSLSLIAGTYDKIVAYYVGIISEAMESLYPAHPQLTALKAQYEQIIKRRWN